MKRLSIGVCEVCKRQGVKVRPRRGSPWARRSHLVCTDTSACFTAWSDADARARAEEGRRLASEREDLIASGVDPQELLIPLHPDTDGTTE